MAKFVGLWLCLALIHTACALECYNCVSTPGNKNCDDFSDPSKISKATCGKVVSNNMKAACIKKVTLDKTTNQMNTTRLCVITKADGKAEAECKPTQSDRTVTVCDVCTDDLCNSGEHVQYSAATVLGAISSYFLARYLY